MTKPTLSARALASQHLEAALETGVRGELRDLIHQAIKAASGARAHDLTDMAYRQLPVGAKLVDPNRAGLLMRHGKRTGRQWFYRFQHPETGKQVELKMGVYPALSTAEARGKWAELRDQRAAGQAPCLSGDPDQPSAQAPTLGELTLRYIAEYARVVKRSWAEDERLLTKHLLPHYGDLPADQFGHEQAAGVLAQLHRTAPREAEKLRAVISTMFNVAVGRTRRISTLEGSWLPPDLPNPVAGVMLPKRAPKNHNPTRAELQSYLRGLDALGEAGQVLRLQVETFARIGEAAGVRWDEIDLDAGVWTLPAERAKNGRAHAVMLARQTVDRLRAMRETATGPFVFQGRGRPDHPAYKGAVMRSLARHRADLGVSDGFTSHATRHAALTWVAENGGGRDVRDRLSNHAPPSGVDAIYNAAELNEPARQWTQKWVDHLTALEAENVILIKGARA